MKAIFDTRPQSGYNDDFDRYHFPDRYLAQAQKAVGDWVIYREPRRGGGRQGYVAVAHLDRIEPDPAIAGHSYARMSKYLQFDTVVPLQNNQEFYEQALALVDVPSRLGSALQGRSIRVISDAEFNAIVRDGLSAVLEPDNAKRLGLDNQDLESETAHLLSAPILEQRRRIEEILIKRPLRDAAFRMNVLSAYDNRCAVTGIHIVNGGGNAEAQAAHIWAVKDGGPDLIQNGIALSSTAHWLFDRHLISLTDDFGLLVSHNRIPAEYGVLFAKQLQRVHLPKDRNFWPYLEFVRRHREAFHA